MTIAEKHHVKEDLRKELHQALTELQRVRDELQVRLHLGGMEVTQAVDQIDKRFFNLQGEVRNAKGKALLASRDAIGDLRASLFELQKKLDGLTRA